MTLLPAQRTRRARVARQISLTLLALAIMATVPASLHGLAFPPLPDLSTFAVHVTCLPRDGEDLGATVDIYQLSRSEDVYVQVYVYIMKFRKMNVELRSDIAIAPLGRTQRAFMKDGEGWKSVSLEEHNRIFAEGMHSQMNGEGQFDPTKFLCRPPQVALSGTTPA